MPRAKQSRGTCSYCGAEIAKGGMTRHLSACLKRRAAIDEAERSKAEVETLYHLRVQDAYQPDFWLDLEVRGSSTLKELDSYLRHIWLECCGHLSEYSLGGWGSRKVAKTRTIGEVFRQSGELTHIYDFGTSSETRITAVEAREGIPTTSRPIALMARNLMPEAGCIDCDRPAAWLCMECLTEEDQAGTLCDDHARSHPHEGYGEPIPLVNSPRLGMCGYTGPAEPPY